MPFESTAQRKGRRPPPRHRLPAALLAALLAGAPALPAHAREGVDVGKKSWAAGLVPGLTPTGAYTAAQLWRSVVSFAGEQQILLAGVGLGRCLWWWGTTHFRVFPSCSVRRSSAWITTQRQRISP